MLIAVENWEQLVLGCCVLSLSRDYAEQLGSRRALGKKRGSEGSSVSCTEGQFSGVGYFFWRYIFRSCWYLHLGCEPWSLFSNLKAFCSEDQFVSTLDDFLFLPPNIWPTLGHVKETWMVCDRREAAVCSCLSSRAWYLEHSQVQHPLLQPCGPVQLDTAQGKWCIWDTHWGGWGLYFGEVWHVGHSGAPAQLMACSARGYSEVSETRSFSLNSTM